jgi:hypothetical protein
VPVVPWISETLTSLFEQLVEAAEEGRVENFLGKCEQAGLIGKLLKEIEGDAHFPKTVVAQTEFAAARRQVAQQSRHLG